MEERGEVAGADKTHRWIVDPLDGTTNFLHGIPMFAISIGFEREGQLIAGLVYNPISDELFAAEKGKGAFLNDKRRLRVAARKTIADAVVATGIPHRGRPGHPGFLKEMETVMREVAGIRRTGSAALDLCWTAAGRFDGYWERNLKPWDLAAGLSSCAKPAASPRTSRAAKRCSRPATCSPATSDIVKGLAPLLAPSKA